MGPLGILLSLPVSGPMAGLTWIARQIANAAMQQLLDPTRIETALLVLERRLEDGQIDEATFEAEEERLLEELAEITALRAAEAEGAVADDEEQTEPPLQPVTQAVISVAERPDPIDAGLPAPAAGAELAGESGAEKTVGSTPSGAEPVPQEVDAWTLA